ncbi:LPD38 domain-containing protein [Entomomonas asaccharolytica]|uniref:LPD38 domain-containing protein n=1 Tax=Entomomonas asaccharolytica TaxID=2785331 RepID=UPI001F395D00
MKLADKALYIPKPFEIGALGTVVERGLEFALASNDYTTKDFVGSLTTLLADQLAMNPMPQLIKPALEATNNYNSFLGSPIDNMGQQRLAAKDRYTAATSAGAIAAGKVLNISPQRIEYLVRGYFGWLGLQVLNITDLAARPLVDLPSNPNRDLSKVNNLFMVGDFIKNSNVGTGSKYLTRFYESQQKIDQVYASLSNARKNGELEYAKELAQDNSLKSRRLYNNAKTRIDKYSQQINVIRANKQISASMKNERIEVLQKRRNKLAESVDRIARARGYL